MFYGGNRVVGEDREIAARIFRARGARSAPVIGEDGDAQRGQDRLEMIVERRRAQRRRGAVRHDDRRDGLAADRQMERSRQLGIAAGKLRSEEHTSELQSLMRSSSAVLCLKKKNTNH